MKLTKTLLLTISLPGFYVEDQTQDHADLYWDGDVSEAALETMDLITRTVRVLIARGDMGGNDLINQHAVILSASVVDREPHHDEPEDERLTEMVLDWRLAK